MDTLIGVIGGMGPEASNYFVKLLNDYSSAGCDQEHPSIIHYSNPRIQDRTAFILEKGEDPVPEIVKAAKTLVDAGVDHLCIPCNTAHAPNIFQRVKKQIDLPILNMVELTVSHIIERYEDVKKVGMLATTGTVVAKSYDEACKNTNISVIYPDNYHQSILMRTVRSVKKEGVTKKNTEALLKVAEEVHPKVDLLIVACTELSLINNTSLRIENSIDSLNILAHASLSLLLPEASKTDQS